MIVLGLLIAHGRVARANVFEAKHRVRQLSSSSCLAAQKPCELCSPSVEKKTSEKEEIYIYTYQVYIHGVHIL